jgi:hypothetical protein
MSANLSKFVVTTNTRTLAATVTVAATDPAMARKIALAAWRRKVPGYTDLSIRVIERPAMAAAWRAAPMPALTSADIDTILSMEAEDFPRYEPI